VKMLLLECAKLAISIVMIPTAQAATGGTLVKRCTGDPMPRLEAAPSHQPVGTGCVWQACPVLGRLRRRTRAPRSMQKEREKCVDLGDSPLCALSNRSGDGTRSGGSVGHPGAAVGLSVRSLVA